MRQQLRATLDLATEALPLYLVRTMRCFITEVPDDMAISTGDIYLDVGVAQNWPEREPVLAAAAAAPALLEFTTIMPTSLPDMSIEIRDVAQRTLVPHFLTNL